MSSDSIVLRLGQVYIYKMKLISYMGFIESKGYLFDEGIYLQEKDLYELKPY